MWPFIIAWIVGLGLLFLYLWSKNKSLRFDDVMITFFLSAGVGFVFSYAAFKANMSHWAVWVAFAAIAFFATFKLLDHK